MNSLQSLLRKLVPSRAALPVVASFPKSGRTWLRVMLNEAGVQATYTHGGSDHIAARPPNQLAAQMKKFRGNRVLFLMRDPRDTAVSGFFQASNRLQNYSGDIHSFIRDERHGIEKIVLFNLLWLKHGRGFRDFCVVHYEDLHADTQAELARAVRFLEGREADPKDIERAVETGRFGNMRKIEASGEGAAVYGDWLAPADAEDTESYKTRRGVVGGWSDYFNADDEDYANRIFDRHDYWNIVGATRRHPQG